MKEARGNIRTFRLTNCEIIPRLLPLVYLLPRNEEETRSDEDTAVNAG